MIDGGNHASFGDYGMKKGDGEATIPREERIACTADAMAAMIR